MPDSPAPPAGASTIDALEALEQNLRDQHELHGQIIQCLDETREALRTSRLDAVTRLCAREHDLVRRLGDLEQSRLALSAGITRTLRPDAAVPLKLDELVSVIDPTRAERLEAVGAELKTRVKEVKQRNAVVRETMGRLNRHMIGIMQTVSSALSRAGVYSRRGHVDPGAQLEFSLDVKT